VRACVCGVGIMAAETQRFYCCLHHHAVGSTVEGKEWADTSHRGLGPFRFREAWSLHASPTPKWLHMSRPPTPMSPFQEIK
jgi:hypothetical protein